MPRRSTSFTSSSVTSRLSSISRFLTSEMMVPRSSDARLVLRFSRGVEIGLQAREQLRHDDAVSAGVSAATSTLS